MSTEAPTRVALVDDHPAVLAGVSAAFREHPDLSICGTARSVDGARALMRETRPNVAVLDLSIVDGDGLPWVANLMSEFTKLKVVLYTLHSEQHLLRNALQMRTSGYVLKSSDPEAVVHAVRAARTGGTYIDPALMSQALDRGFGGQAAGPEPATKISKREFETLRLTALGYGIKEIADELTISAKSVETYKLRGAEKLGLKSRSAIVRYAIANGWFSTIE